ncbi:MAG: signal peptidase II [Candidatus Peregrinibacteria bacterium]|nr:signal peptidase II [Candidatus Peregrinibacteria bacterium]MCB9807878.1 signal peptidase II [Candidatus Peribacteria bacterium]
MRNILPISIGISLLLSVVGAKAADFWLSERIAVLGSFAGLQYSLNPGIAWGIRFPPVIQEVLIGLALLAVFSMAWKSAKERQLSAFGMILGGGLANIIDRIQDGYVTDFIQIGSFPIFNVADSFVTVGVLVLLVDQIVYRSAK